MAKTVNTSKKVKLKILQNFQDKHTNKDYKRNDVIEFSEERAQELLKNNPCLVKKIEEAEKQDNNQSEMHEENEAE